VAKAQASKPAAQAAKSEPKQQAKAEAAKSEAAKPATTALTANADPFKSAKPAEKKEEKKEDKKWAMNGKRDPFFSPVVQQGGSGCSTGKKCLEIGAINLRGVVKSDTGFIAVVTNNLNKAYFLRENDPVFNGYVVKITGDSVVFQETIQDKLGKPFTREIVKRIFTPAV
jgi:membrane protein involved in colicin uptake